MFGRRRRADRPAGQLYERAVDAAREPGWYLAGGVPDTMDGRFDVLTTVLALAFLRLQEAGERQAEADLMDRFAADMDATMREVGVGDLTVGKHVGRAVGALGGRVQALSAALAGSGEALEAVLARNLYRGEAPDREGLRWSARRVAELYSRLRELRPEALAAGELAL